MRALRQADRLVAQTNRRGSCSRPCRELVGGHRAGEQVPLDDVRSQFSQGVELRRRVDAFGGDETEVMTEVDDHPDEGGVVGAVQLENEAIGSASLSANRSASSRASATLSTRSARIKHSSPPRRATTSPTPNRARSPFDRTAGRNHPKPGGRRSATAPGWDRSGRGAIVVARLSAPTRSSTSSWKRRGARAPRRPSV